VGGFSGVGVVFFLVFTMGVGGGFGVGVGVWGGSFLRKSKVVICANRAGCALLS